MILGSMLSVSAFAANDVATICQGDESVTLIYKNNLLEMKGSQPGQEQTLEVLKVRELKDAARSRIADLASVKTELASAVAYDVVVNQVRVSYIISKDSEENTLVFAEGEGAVALLGSSKGCQ